jgi:dTDP-4-dehydrorhamnose reductase
MPSRPLRILLIGSTGQVGWELERTLAPLGEVVAAGRRDGAVVLDMVRPDTVRAAVHTAAPDLIVNAAAYTAVDQAEAESALARAVNAEGPALLAEEAKGCGAFLVHYSTDYVFDGGKGSPYTEDDAPNPRNVYGASKLEGERAVAASGAAHLILRTSWVYAARGRNFLRTIVRRGGEGAQLRVVDDQIGSPTWARLLAEATAQIIAAHPLEGLREHSGLYHVSAGGAVSWHGFAEAILAQLGGPLAATTVQAIPSSAYPQAAERPRYSVLANDRFVATFGLRLPSWQAGLRLCLADGVQSSEGERRMSDVSTMTHGND